MNTARVSVCLAILLAGTFVSPLFAQGPPGIGPVYDDPAPDTFDPLDHRNIMLRSDIGDGVGYSKGFQTFSLFQPIIVEPDEFLFYLNPRGIITYLGDVAANAGAGFRMYNDQSDRIFGGSFWYDTDNTGQRKYDQLGISLESLGQYLDIRVNGYMPTNDDRDNLGSYMTGQNQFFGNFIGLGRSTTYLTPLKGGDFEVGGALGGIGDIGFRAYVGGYYYQGEGTGAAYGVRARIESLITQDFWGTVAVTNDRLFGTNLTGAVTWYYGSGQSPRWFQRIPVKDRLYQQVERQYRIAVYEEVFQDTVTALRDGGTGGSGGPVGTPIFVVHVDNSASGGGNGTVESPYSQLPTSTPSNVDIVFVNRGNGTSNGYNHGITLNDYQRLLGNGIHHEFRSTTGVYQLPGYQPGGLPNLTNPGGDVVRLASHNEVSGFNIAGAGRHGVFGQNIVDFNLNNLHISNSGKAGPPPVGGGVSLVNATGMGRVFDSSFTDNFADGFRVVNVGGDLELRIDDVSSNRNLTGLSIKGQGSANFNVIARNLNAGGSDHDGIDVEVTANSSIVGVFENVTSSGNNNPQIDAGFGDGFNLTADASVADIAIRHSTFNNNNLNGLSFTANNGSDLDVLLENNNATISNNQRSGVRFLTQESKATAILKNNVIRDNGRFGVSITATGGRFDLIAGGLGTEDTNGNGILDPGEDANGNGLFDRDGNIIDNNRGAGIAYTLRDSARGFVDIRGNVITRTQDDTIGSTIYNGQGIDLRLTGTTIASDASAVLEHGIIDRNTIGSTTDSALGNAGAGIFVVADQRTTLQDLTIGNTSGVPQSGNIIARNRGDGIHIVRQNEAIVNNVIIGANRIARSGGDGIDISAENSQNDVNDYTIRDNQIVNNTIDGIRLHVEADAALSTNIDNNFINSNGLHGIQTTELANSASDLRFVTGNWTRNVITNNGFGFTPRGDGINLSGAVQGLAIGSAVDPSMGNVISDNGGAGIRQLGAGTLTIGNNEISRNGAGGIILNPASTNTYNIVRNVIFENTGDGLQLLAQGPFSITMNANLNTIRDNTGRGVNILNRVLAGFNFSNTTVNMSDNVISGNRGIGVYVVNTSSATQSINAAATDTLASDGSIFAVPRLNFSFTNNRVEGNGIGSNFSTSGLVLRVGTSDGGYNAFTNDGGFFNDPVFGANGGVGATITGNRFHGNLGDDVYFDSFRSTVDPPASAGTWSQTEFTLTSYFGDPLARLDLTFNDNEVDSFDVTNPGAFYNNAEGTFKSRTTAAQDPGPFTTDTRQRNAQRLAGRFGLGPATPGGLSDLFLYPGIGQSTFRLLSAPTGNSDAGGSTNPFAFATDNAYTSPFFDANGIYTPGGFNGIDKMPYGWNQFGDWNSPPRPQ
ncbi:MAG: beta strand repeat-containing protein [Planctomycetales bacterium]